MIPMTRLALTSMLILALVFSARAQDEKPEVRLTTDQLEDMLEKMNVRFNKESRTDPNGRVVATYFNIKVGKNRAVLEAFDQGRALVIGTNLPDVTNATLEKVNLWNDQKALSRAVLRVVTEKDGRRVTFPRLEADLDCSGGVSARNVERLVRRFEQSVREFEQFFGPQQDPNARPDL